MIIFDQQVLPSFFIFIYTLFYVVFAPPYIYVLFPKLPLKVSFCVCSLGSYMERSTVDFIVPGEMELTSAVRSVSCGSTINKCNGSVPPSAMASNSAASKALLPHNKVSSYLFTFICLYCF